MSSDEIIFSSGTGDSGGPIKRFLNPEESAQIHQTLDEVCKHSADKMRSELYFKPDPWIKPEKAPESRFDGYRSDERIKLGTVYQSHDQAFNTSLGKSTVTDQANGPLRVIEKFSDSSYQHTTMRNEKDGKYNDTLITVNCNNSILFSNIFGPSDKDATAADFYNSSRHLTNDGKIIDQELNSLDPMKSLKVERPSLKGGVVKATFGDGVELTKSANGKLKLNYENASWVTKLLGPDKLQRMEQVRSLTSRNDEILKDALNLWKSKQRQ